MKGARGAAGMAATGGAKQQKEPVSKKVRFQVTSFS